MISYSMHEPGSDSKKLRNLGGLLHRLHMILIVLKPDAQY